MKYKQIYFSGHATVQMFKRGIQAEDVERVLKTGLIIKNYPDDKPYPSFLILGFVEKRPLHVVSATDRRGNCYIVTVYEPDKKLWNNDFKTKR
jgi:hypothetical protein